MPSLGRRNKLRSPDLLAVPDAEWRVAQSLGAEHDPQAIPALLKAMHGYDEDRAARARELVEAMDARDATPALIAALREPRRYDPELVGALLAGFAPASVPALVRALADPKAMHSAAEVLCELKAPEAVPALIDLAQTARRKRRRDAVWALGPHGSPDGYDTALGALSSSDKKLRRAGAFALGAIGDPRAVKPLAGALSHRDSDLRASAAYALSSIDDPAAVEPLIGALEDRDGDVRQSAVFALGKRRDPRAVPALIALLRAQAHLLVGLSYSAAKAVSECEPEGTAALMDAARDPNPRVRYWALIGLERDRGRPPIADDTLIRFLGECVADDDQHASHAAASALKPYKDRLAADVLLAHLSDPRAHVRDSAVWGIWAHRDDDVVEELARLLGSDPDAEVRKDAAWGLGVTRSPKARTPLLEAIASETDPDVIENAKRSLGWIAEQRL